MTSLLDTFLGPAPSLKICGVTTGSDAEALAALGIHALGVNFWEKSKRYCPLASARAFLPALRDRILRVGVFVNADPALPRRLLEEGLLDLVQFHGDESLSYCREFARDEIPFIKAVGIDKSTDLGALLEFPATALLLDAPAPGLYGGTGRTNDWTLVARFIARYSPPPVILAGGITPENAAQALAATRAVALDVASGAETSPGLKDFAKAAALLEAVRKAASH